MGFITMKYHNKPKLCNVGSVRLETFDNENAADDYAAEPFRHNEDRASWHILKTIRLVPISRPPLFFQSSFW